MSALSISPTFSSGPSVAPCLARTVPSSATVKLTRRGQIVVVLTVLACALAVMVAFGGWATATHDSGKPEQVSVVEVQPGDTLYAIAGRVAAPGKVREMVHHIQQLNSLSGAGLQVGQKIAIPAN
jgi:predicted Zn-dependent protease